MAQGQRVANIFVNLQAQTAQFSRGMKAATQQLGKLQVAAAAGTAAVAVGIGKSIEAFADFDDAMQQSRAIMGDLTQKEMQDMEAAALQVARTTTTSAEEAAESFFFLASAGLDARQSVEALPAVAEFAQAGMFDMARATDLATDAQSALGLKSQDAQENLKNLTRVTDVLVKANTLANATVEQFSESLTNKLGARLRSVNKDIEEGAAALAVLADQGVKGRRAGSGLNIILRDLQSTAVRNAEQFRELGIRVFDSAGEMRNIADIVADFERAMGSASSEQKAMQAEFLGINRRAQDFLQLLIGNSEALRRYESQMRVAGGITGEVADKQLDTLIKQLGLMKAELFTVVIAIGKGFIPQMDTATGGMREFTRGLADSAEKIRAISARAAAFGSLMANLGETAANVVSIVARSITAGLGAALGAVGELVNTALLRPLNKVAEFLGKDFRFALIDSATLLNMWRTAAENIEGDLGDMATDMGQVVDAFDNAANAVSVARWDVAGEEIRRTGQASAQSSQQMDELGKSLGGGGGGESGVAGAASSATVEVRDLGFTLQDLNDMISDQESDRATDMLERYGKQMEQVSSVTTEAAEKTENFGTVNGEVVTDLNRVVRGGEDAADRTSDLARELERAARTGIDFARTLGLIGDSAAATLGSVVNLGSAVGDVVKGISSGASFGSMLGPIGAGLGAIGGIVSGLFGDSGPPPQQRAAQQRSQELNRLRSDLQVTITLLTESASRLRSAASSIDTSTLGEFEDFFDELERTGASLPFSGVERFRRELDEAGLTLNEVQETARAFGINIDELIQILVTGEGDVQRAQIQMDALHQVIDQLPDAAGRAAVSLSELMNQLDRDLRRFGVDTDLGVLERTLEALMQKAFTATEFQEAAGPLRERIAEERSLLQQFLDALDDLQEQLARTTDSQERNVIQQAISALNRKIAEQEAVIAELTQKLGDLAEGGGPLFQLIQQLEAFDFTTQTGRTSAIGALNAFIDMIRAEGRQLPEVPESEEAALESDLIDLIELIRGLGEAADEAAGGGAGGGGAGGGGGLTPTEPPTVSRPGHLVRARITAPQASELISIDRENLIRNEQQVRLQREMVRLLSGLPTGIRDGMDLAISEELNLEQTAA